MLQNYNTDYFVASHICIIYIICTGAEPNNQQCHWRIPGLFGRTTIGGPVTWELRPEEDYGALDQGKWGEMSGIFFVGISLGTYIYISYIYIILYYIIL